MTAKRVEYHQGAAGDVENAITWYRKRSAKAALNFIDELERAVHTIREAPRHWPIGKNNTRRFLLWRFPFAIVYSEQKSEIIIWAVSHSSRRPEHWTGRLD